VVGRAIRGRRNSSSEPEAGVYGSEFWRRSFGSSRLIQSALLWRDNSADLAAWASWGRKPPSFLWPLSFPCLRLVLQTRGCSVCGHNGLGGSITLEPLDVKDPRLERAGHGARTRRSSTSRTRRSYRSGVFVARYWVCLATAADDSQPQTRNRAPLRSLPLRLVGLSVRPRR